MNSFIINKPNFHHFNSTLLVIINQFLYYLRFFIRIANRFLTLYDIEFLPSQKSKGPE